jgi:MBG domain (YGX type)
VVSGAAQLSTAALRNSAAGPYPIAVATGTLSAANYTFTPSAGTLTITGGAPQVISFKPLPNFVSGASYQLVSMASSGLPNAYAVSGPATVAGSTLTVTGPGAVTVTASNGGNGSYAAAANVSQSFTAQ